MKLLSQGTAAESFGEWFSDKFRLMVPPRAYFGFHALLLHEDTAENPAAVLPYSTESPVNLWELHPSDPWSTCRFLAYNFPVWALMTAAENGPRHKVCPLSLETFTLI